MLPGGMMPCCWAVRLNAGSEVKCEASTPCASDCTADWDDSRLAISESETTSKLLEPSI